MAISGVISANIEKDKVNDKQKDAQNSQAIAENFDVESPELLANDAIMNYRTVAGYCL